METASDPASTSPSAVCPAMKHHIIHLHFVSFMCIAQVVLNNYNSRKFSRSNSQYFVN